MCLGYGSSVRLLDVNDDWSPPFVCVSWKTPDRVALALSFAPGERVPTERVSVGIRMSSGRVFRSRVSFC